MKLKQILFGPYHSHVMLFASSLLVYFAGYSVGHDRGFDVGVKAAETFAVKRHLAYRVWTSDRGWHVEWEDVRDIKSEAYQEGVQDASELVLDKLRQLEILKTVPKKQLDHAEPDWLPPPGWIPRPAPAPAPADANAFDALLVATQGNK